MRSSKSSRVKVGIRIRPLTSEEKAYGAKSILTTASSSSNPNNHKHNHKHNIVSLDLLGVGRNFGFDAVYDEHISQAHLYERVGANKMLEAFLEGYNSTILAYGQTGSGKTFTMGSADYGSTATLGMVDNDNDDDGGNVNGGDGGSGLIPRFLHDIFDNLRRRKKQDSLLDKKAKAKGYQGRQSKLMDYKVSASFLEVYGEDIHDLLADGHDGNNNNNNNNHTGTNGGTGGTGGGKYQYQYQNNHTNSNSSNLHIREDSKGNVMVAGLQNRQIHDAVDAMEVLKEGTRNRTTAATAMNKKSSRSHAVLTITLEQTTREHNDGAALRMGTMGMGMGMGMSSNSNSNSNSKKLAADKKERGQFDITSVSRFTFVDLAGSERMKKTGAKGKRARECIMINRGLLALGNVINALAVEEKLSRGNDGRLRRAHVPYRDSALTRLLQDALGGNSQTLFLACVSPADTNASETASTLKYANRAKNIKNRVKKNVDPAMMELQRLYTLNQMLERELVRVRYTGRESDGAGAGAGAGANSEGTSIGYEYKDIGMVSDELLFRNDVQEYLERIRRKAINGKNVLPANANTPNVYGGASVGSAPSIAPTVSNLESDSISGILHTTFPNLEQESASIGTSINTSTHGPHDQDQDRDLNQISETASTDGSLSTRTGVGSSARVSPSSSPITIPEPPAKIQRRHRRNRSRVMDNNIEGSFLTVHSQQDIELLDKMIELQRFEEEFDGGSQKDNNQIQDLGTELEKQENALLRVRKKIKSYQFEDVTMELRSLEIEKNALEQSLEAASRQPGSSSPKSLQKRLDNVMAKLGRAHEGTEKRKTLFKEAGEDAHKAQLLGQEIERLKREKFELVEKQIEASTRFEEFMENKGKEIRDLKVKGGNNTVGQRILDFEIEVQNQLQIRKRFNQKLADKFKQTELHLVKVLSKRKRKGNLRFNVNRAEVEAILGTSASKEFVPKSLEITPLKFLLDKLVKDIVALSLLRSSHEVKVVEYNNLMRNIVSELKVLNEAQDMLHLYDGNDALDIEQKIEESKQSIEELEYNLKGAEQDLQRTRSELQRADEGDSSEFNPDNLKFESDTMNMIATYSGPVTKTLLWDIMEFTTKSEVSKLELRTKLYRKDQALSSLENENQYLNQHITQLTNGIEGYSGTPLREISNLKNKI